MLKKLPYFLNDLYKKTHKIMSGLMAIFKIFNKPQKKAVSKKPAKVEHRPKKHAPAKAVHHKPVAKVEHKHIVAKAPSVSAKKEVKLEFNKMPDEKAYELLKKYRIAMPEYEFCKTEEDVKLALKKIGFPCVLKVSGEIIHKTNVNGVRTSISSEEDALKAFKELIKIKGCQKVLVQKMITEGYEIIVGGKKDPQFNTVIALGAGGIFTEFLKDVSFRIAPVSKEDAENLIKEVKFSDLLLKGFRGQKPADANSIVEVIMAVSRIMEGNPNIKELDINPLFATSAKALAADVRVILD
jgi:acetate---CoA ligase (ADP-forming) subunit beta